MVVSHFQAGKNDKYLKIEIWPATVQLQLLLYRNHNQVKFSQQITL